MKKPSVSAVEEHSMVLWHPADGEELVGQQMYYSDNPLTIELLQPGHQMGALLEPWDSKDSTFTLKSLDGKTKFSARYVRPVPEVELTVLMTKEEIAKQLNIIPADRLKILGGVE